RLARGQRAGEVAPAPGIREPVARNLRAARRELLDLTHPDLLSSGPRRDLVLFAHELLRIFSDHLDQQPRGLGIDLHVTFLELSRHPLAEATLRDVVRQDVAGLRARLA